MLRSSSPRKALLTVLTLAALSGCASTTTRLEPVPDPKPEPPVACLRPHPATLTELDDAYVDRANVDKARDELRRKAEDGERYAALLRDHEACSSWVRDGRG